MVGVLQLTVRHPFQVARCELDAKLGFACH